MKATTATQIIAFAGWAIIAVIFYAGREPAREWKYAEATAPTYASNNLARLSEYERYQAQGDAAAVEKMKQEGYLHHIPAGEKMEVLSNHAGGAVIQARPLGDIDRWYISARNLKNAIPDAKGSN